MHGRSEIFTTVGSYEHKPASLSPCEIGVRVAVMHCCAQCIDACIARYIDAFGGLPLGEEVLAGLLRRREVVLRDNINGLTVELFRPRRVEVAGAQARLYVADGYLEVESCERGSERGGRVSMNKDDIWMARLECFFDIEQDVACYVEERLPGLHYRQIVIGCNGKCLKNLIEHLPMLPRHAYERLEIVRPPLKLAHQRAHLNCLRPCAEDEHDALATFCHGVRLQLVDVVARAAYIAGVKHHNIAENGGVVF